MVFGLCSAGTEFFDFTETSFELHRTRAFKKYGSQWLALLLRLLLILTTVIVFALVILMGYGQNFRSTIFMCQLCQKKSF